MSRAITWNHLGIAIAALIAIAVGCLALGNTSAASAVFVVAIAEAVFGAGYLSMKRRA